MEVFFGCGGNPASRVSRNCRAGSNRQRCKRNKMNYLEIKIKPKNEADYIKTPPHDQRERFVESLMALLQQGALQIKTGCIPITWATEAIEFSNSNGYKVMMIRSNDPSDPGGIMSTLGHFYFHRPSA
jgi:hypothetical protein